MDILKDIFSLAVKVIKNWFGFYFFFPAGQRF